MQKMSSYDAKYDRVFEVPSTFNPGKTTKCCAVDKLACLINTDWVYSMYWPSDDFNGLLDKAQADLNKEIGKAMARIAELKEAQDIISSIERESDDIEE